MPESALTPHAHDLLQAQYSNMQSCVRCAACLPVCPTYQVSMLEQEGPRGRIAMAKALAEGNLGLTPDLIEHWDSCLVCDACTAACPAGVRMEPIAQSLRAAVNETRGDVAVSPALKVAMKWVLPNLGVMRAVVSMSGLLQRTGVSRLARWMGVLKVLGLEDFDALLPPVRAAALVPSGQVWEPVGPHRATVALLAGCFMSTVFPDTDLATARVLAANGCRVLLPESQGCCGSVHAHRGELEGARELARRNIEALEAVQADAIVVNSAGCANTMKHYTTLLAADPKYAHRAAALAARVRDFSEYLMELGTIPPTHSLSWRVTYQEPCHLAHAQRIRTAPRDLLRLIPGLELREMQESSLCCGAGPLNNVTEPEISEELRARKLRNAAATEAEVIVTANPGCHVQLARGLRELGSKMRVTHIADVLDAAYQGQH